MEKFNIIDKGKEIVDDGKDIVDKPKDAAEKEIKKLMGPIVDIFEDLSKSGKKFNDLMSSFFIKDIIALPGKVDKFANTLGDKMFEIIKLLGTMIMDLIKVYFLFWGALIGGVMDSPLGTVIYWGSFGALLLFMNTYIYTVQNSLQLGVWFYIVSYIILYVFFINIDDLLIEFAETVFTKKVLLMALDKSVEQSGDLLEQLFLKIKKNVT